MITEIQLRGIKQENSTEGNQTPKCEDGQATVDVETQKRQHLVVEISGSVSSRDIRAMDTFLLARKHSQNSTTQRQTRALSRRE